VDIKYPLKADKYVRMVSKYPSQAPAPKFEEAGKIAHVRGIAVPGLQAGVKRIAGLLPIAVNFVCPYKKNPGSAGSKRLIPKT
jgi:hypothetical protein